MFEHESATPPTCHRVVAVEGRRATRYLYGVLKQKPKAVRWIGALAATALVAIGAVTLVRYSDPAIRIPRRTWHFFESPTGDPADAAALPQFSRLAPLERDDPDAGVAAAAREYAVQLIVPNLKSTDSAEVPEGQIHFERMKGLNATTGDRIEHWLADGVAVSPNDFGVRVPAHWRIMIARSDDSFFPVTALLEGVEVYRMRGHWEMLMDARQEAWQEQRDQVTARKERDVAESRAAWKAREEAKPVEEKAQAALKLATILINAGRTEAAQGRLKEVIEKFPGTAAAAEAQGLLNQ
jgi:hypothetical protein